MDNFHKEVESLIEVSKLMKLYHFRFLKQGNSPIFKFIFGSSIHSTYPDTIKVPKCFNIKDEIHLCSLFHEIGHFITLRRIGKEKYYNNHIKHNQKSFIWTMKNEILAWKEGFREMKRLGYVVTETMVKEASRCVATYYDNCEWKKNKNRRTYSFAHKEIKPKLEKIISKEIK